MNKIIIQGVIDNIEYSHTINSVDFYKANLRSTKEDGEENNISLRFKHIAPYKNGDKVNLVGNIRSFTEKFDDGKNKVNIYVFTYFDIPDSDNQPNNYFKLDGRICKLDKLRFTKDGKKRMHIILANNIFSADGTQKLNNYIPIVAFDDLADKLAALQISDQIEVTGTLQSRIYTKTLEDGTQEEKVAYEGILSSCLLL